MPGCLGSQLGGFTSCVNFTGPPAGDCLAHGDSFSTAAGDEEGDFDASLLQSSRSVKRNDSAGEVSRLFESNQTEDIRTVHCASSAAGEATRPCSSDKQNAKSLQLVPLTDHTFALPLDARRSRPTLREGELQTPQESLVSARKRVLAFDELEEKTQREASSELRPSGAHETKTGCVDAATLGATLGTFFDGVREGNGGPGDGDLEIFGVAAKIKDGLFLGDSYVAQDEEFFIANKITHVINCSCLQTPNFFQNSALAVSYLNLPCPEQGPMEPLLNADDFLSAVIFQFIEESLTQCEGCLVHSVRGQSRAATVLLAYFMQKYSWSLSKAEEFLFSRRPGLEMRDEHWTQLKQLERRLSRARGRLSRSWSVDTDQTGDEEDAMGMKNRVSSF
ncbi:conserved hypothetical protein [Neospora caninum Liverpool]|uniref:Protein tyrosine phosphatase n=1 Tax=Neospora caninum (strain Liverpool) TaxID=572307 RepID=F0VN04_NEOCL|nr:conserved hypothetical protein [Neospora caninum Liverpool]CBZ55100.1 conserved hypothetical protein [Neospora caninum Liverpool]CEL69826.1 TPA: Protein tyrosine phosphatase [Neospora caninum Liverpool]|eukprot:XP_003885128.1 conserved hypothetical protein [Neospora caninum Liverpool]